MASKWKAGIPASALMMSSMPGACAGPKPGQRFMEDVEGHNFRHVLLISIDGMHGLAFANCSNCISTINDGEPYCPNLAALGEHGVNYLGASASTPSDSFPGFTALVTGSSPRTTGVFYDVAYDRSLDRPAAHRGNGILHGSCIAGTPPIGTRTEYEEGISIDQSMLNGGAPGASLTDGGRASLDPTKIPRDPSRGCAPVYPWHFLRVNTIYGVIHAAGLYTAWADKHPDYLSVFGPGDGPNVDDYYAPQINTPCRLFRKSTRLFFPGCKRCGLRLEPAGIPPGRKIVGDTKEEE